MEVLDNEDCDCCDDKEKQVHVEAITVIVGAVIVLLVLIVCITVYSLHERPADFRQQCIEQHGDYYGGDEARCLQR
jgi:hypothetical protein